MPAAAPRTVDNRLIASLPRALRTRLLAIAEPVELAFGDVLCQPGQPYRWVYFPRHAFISQMACVDDHPPLEMALVGYENMIGATSLLDVPLIAPLLAVVQGAGDAWRIPVARFRKLLRDSPALRRLIGRVLQLQLTQLARNAACTHFHAVDARLARWLLMTHDRAHGGDFALTHQYLGDMLGVRRSAITIAAGNLQREGLIHYRRGEISILDRPGLEAAACECYAALNRDYAERFGD